MGGPHDFPEKNQKKTSSLLEDVFFGVGEGFTKFSGFVQRTPGATVFFAGG